MTEQECLELMVAPGQVRTSKPYRGGVIQIWTTRACDKACFHCTQGSNYGGKPGMISVEQFRTACRSLKGYFGVVGMFGGNPATHPCFEDLCQIMSDEIPFEQRGIWCNNPLTVEKAAIMRQTFNPGYSNLNVHLDRRAYDLFKLGWPECNPVGLATDSRHSPVFVAMKDLDQLPTPEPRGSAAPVMPNTEANRWELISQCDINQFWSAMIGVFRGELRGWFCEVAGAQAMLHQDDPDYPDTGVPIPEPVSDPGWQWDNSGWWELPMQAFAHQARKHCHECGVPLRGFGELAMSQDGCEQTSEIHASVAKPKRQGRPVLVVRNLAALGIGRLQKMTQYLKNAEANP